MSLFVKRVLYWAPRLLCIAFILGLAWFTLRVFTEEQDFLQTSVSLLRHLVPCFIFTAVLMFAWKWEWVGASVFSAFALYYGAENLRHPRWVLSVSLPLLAVGLLFFASWLTNARAVQPQD